MTRSLAAIALVGMVLGATPSAITASDALVVTPNDAILVPTTGPEIAPAPLDPCEAFGGDDLSCGVVARKELKLVYTIERGPTVDDVLVTRPWVVRVYAIDDHECVAPCAELLPRLETSADDGEHVQFADVSAAAGDVTGDGEPELLIGYRSEGTGQILDVDIVGISDVDLSTEVLTHLQLYKGTAKIKNGRLLTWTPVYKQTDANCCPTWIRRDVVRYEDGVFVVHEGRKVPTEDAHIPKGDF